MRIILIALLFNLALCSATAQQQQIDSLTRELKKSTVEDTSKIKILNGLSYAYYQLNTDEGIVYANQAIALSEKISDEKGMGYAYHFKGINYAEKGDYGTALELYRKAAGIFEKINEQRRLAAVRNSTAIVYMRLSDYASALDLYYKNLHGYELQGMNMEIAMTNGNIALVYSRMGNYEKSLSFNQKAIEIRKKLNDEKGLADLLNSRGNSLDDMGKPAEALPFYRQSLYFCNKINYVKGIASANSNLGNVFNEVGLYDSALYYTKNAIDYYQRVNDKNNLAVVLSYYGNIISKASNQLLLKEGISPTNKYSKAINYYQQSLSIGIEVEDISGQAENWLNISGSYKKMNQFDKALYAHEQFIKLKDSIFNDEKKESIHQIEMQYSVQKKEDSLTVIQQKKDIAANAEINRQKTIKKTIIQR